VRSTTRSSLTGGLSIRTVSDVDRITEVSVEHDGQAVFDHTIHAETPPLALSLAMQRIRHEIETSPGKVTRVWFTYDTDEEE
jgi:hypothetical protein